MDVGFVCPRRTGALTAILAPALSDAAANGIRFKGRSYGCPRGAGALVPAGQEPILEGGRQGLPAR